MGSRDNMIPKFDGNTLGWEADAGGGLTSVGRNNLAQSAVDFIQAQSSLLTAWDGLVDPLTAGWGSSATGKYSATRHEWPLIGSGAGTPSNDRNNPLYQANEAVDWERAFAFRWQQRFTHVASGATNTLVLRRYFGAAMISPPLRHGLGNSQKVGFLDYPCSHGI